MREHRRRATLYVHLCNCFPGFYRFFVSQLFVITVIRKLISFHCTHCWWRCSTLPIVVKAHVEAKEWKNVVILWYSSYCQMWNSYHIISALVQLFSTFLSFFVSQLFALAVIRKWQETCVLSRCGCIVTENHNWNSQKYEMNRCPFNFKGDDSCWCLICYKESDNF